MAELERDLRGLAAVVDLPAERDLWPGIQARLVTRTRRPWLRIAAVVVAAAVVAIGVAFAVPPARSAILRFLGLEGVTIVRVEKLPPAAKGPGAVGRRVTLERAKHMLVFEPLLPDIGAPDAIYVDTSQALLTVIYGKRDVRLRVTELIAGSAPFTKIVTVEQHVEQVRVKDSHGLWIEGEHVVSGLFGEPELSGNALIWEQLPVTIRLEGRITKAQALRIARSFRPR